MIERFWDLVILPTCNDVCDGVQRGPGPPTSSRPASCATRTAPTWASRASGCRGSREAARERFEAAAGGASWGRAPPASSIGTGGRAGVALAGDPVEADAVVLALPPNRARSLLPDAWRDRRGLADLKAFRYSPIVNVHLRWDRPLLRDDFVAVLDPDVQYVFNRTRIRGGADAEADGGQWVAVSLSGAHEQPRCPRPTSRRRRSPRCGGPSPRRAAPPRRP